MPFDIGTYLSTPVMLTGGTVYGTLCCFSLSPNVEVCQRDLRNLQSVAFLVAKKVEQSQALGHIPRLSRRRSRLRRRSERLLRVVADCHGASVTRYYFSSC